jgi:hypothetical protein
MKTDTEYEREFSEMWDGQLLDYPTITRNDAGEWNYFDVKPAYATVIWEDGVRKTLDGVSDSDVMMNQGEDLALETLAIADQCREADSVALHEIMVAALKAFDGPDRDRSVVAWGFTNAILDAAVRGRDAQGVFISHFRRDFHTGAA